MWKKIADLSWLTLLAAFGVWLAGWLLGVYRWVPGVRELAVVVGYFIALEVVLLCNDEPNDTLSERIRRLARLKALVPLVWGMVGGAGIVAATLPVDWDKFKAVAIVAALGCLSGHFFVPPGRRPTPDIAVALFVGLAYGIGVGWVAAFQTTDVNELFAFMATALFGVLIGARYFELRG